VAETEDGGDWHDWGGCYGRGCTPWLKELVTAFFSARCGPELGVKARKKKDADFHHFFY
jgi:hypothetical protein